MEKILEKSKQKTDSIIKETLLLGEATYDQIGSKYGFATSVKRTEEQSKVIEIKQIQKEKNIDNVFFKKDLFQLAEKHTLLVVSPRYFKGDISLEHMKMIEENELVDNSNVLILCNPQYTKYAIFCKLVSSDRKSLSKYTHIVSSKDSPFSFFRRVLNLLRFDYREYKEYNDYGEKVEVINDLKPEDSFIPNILHFIVVILIYFISRIFLRIEPEIIGYAFIAYLLISLIQFIDVYKLIKKK